MKRALGRGCQPWPARRGRGGFTLVELLISLFVMSLILAASGASVTLLLRSAENGRDLLQNGSMGAASASAQTLAARAAVDVLCADLKLASSMANVPMGTGGFELTLTVPPRYAGHVSEIVIYRYAGPGQPLTRQLNGADAVTIAENVTSLSFASLTRATR